MQRFAAYFEANDQSSAKPSCISPKLQRRTAGSCRTEAATSRPTTTAMRSPRSAAMKRPRSRPGADHDKLTAPAGAAAWVGKREQLDRRKHSALSRRRQRGERKDG